MEGEGLHVTPLFFSPKIQALLLGCLQNTGALEQALRSQSLPVLQRPNSHLPPRRAMPRRLGLPVYGAVAFVAVFYI